MQRIVHFDFKGAPLKLPYLKDVVLLIKSLGATGVLLEWEDTFPYTGQLRDIGSVTNSGGDGLYSLEEVQYILQLLKDNKLDAIQLVQTFGHMEFVLKYPKYQELREVERSPSVLCPTKPKSLALVKALLGQVLEVQPDAKFLHIGADEVWHMSICDDCIRRAKSSKHKKDSLFLEHVRDIALFVKKKRPELTVLMWDDMLRSISPDILAEYNLRDLVQPVLWHYNTAETFRIDPDLWRNYGQLFPAVWAASAFKGANGSCQLMSQYSHYNGNHEAWVQEIKNHSDKVNFAGIILTGWSRFDHYASLCELMLVSMLSLDSCLRIIHKNFGGPAETEDLADQWPGDKLARCMHTFILVRRKCIGFINGDMATTWLNPWQVQRKFTNPMHADGLVYATQTMLSEITNLKNELAEHLSDVTGERSKNEWLESYVMPVIKMLTDLYDIADITARKPAGIRP